MHAYDDKHLDCQIQTLPISTESHFTKFNTRQSYLLYGIIGMYSLCPKSLFYAVWLTHWIKGSSSSRVHFSLVAKSLSNLSAGSWGNFKIGKCQITGGILFISVRASPCHEKKVLRGIFMDDYLYNIIIHVHSKKKKCSPWVALSL